MAIQDFTGGITEDMLTDSRSRIPKYGANLVGAPALNLSKFATPLVAATAVIVSGLAPVFGLGHFPTFESLKGELPKTILALGFMLVLATAVIAVTIAWSADMRTRGLVTAASLSLRAEVQQPNVTMAPPGAPGQSVGLWVKRQGRGDDDLFLVVAASPTPSGSSLYLLAKGDDTPEWVPADKISQWVVKENRPG